MKRPRWSRCLIGLWGVWFALVLLGPPSLHACPAHAMAGAMSMTHMDAMATAETATHDSAPADGRQHQSDRCNCLGCCCCVAIAAPPATPIRLAEAALVGADTRLELRAGNPIVRRTYARPFANGPPALGRS